jgi:hypothetical protein
MTEFVPAAVQSVCAKRRNPKTDGETCVNRADWLLGLGGLLAALISTLISLAPIGHQLTWFGEQ